MFSFARWHRTRSCAIFPFARRVAPGFRNCARCGICVCVCVFLLVFISEICLLLLLFCVALEIRSTQVRCAIKGCGWEKKQERLLAKWHQVSIENLHRNLQQCAIIEEQSGVLPANLQRIDQRKQASQQPTLRKLNLTWEWQYRGQKM